ncbi:DUF4065 domain-containing protein [Bacillus paralicheniformis]|uniref:Panacea domain-containing protein n=1 Tax=Bacillus TaxID=1386 RepID=UPI001C24BC19|nr:type II toxin-antitoxin system antitoxin SocA domain-containing protein [Bacillus paralicheniformis]MBU8583010.1 DUF4065 domain-containing protein [Bacillus paralicheniformis]
MFEHFIILFSDYREGRRIGFHKSSPDSSEIFEFMDILDDLKREFGNLSFGVHTVQTMDASWESVVEYDKFFSDVLEVKSLDLFKKYIREDNKITALDVANLFISKKACTHLKLQKLIYFFYCKFVKKYGSRPFDEQFIAWQYGPVVREVYDKYKEYGRQEITLNKEDDSEDILKGDPFKMSVHSKFKKTDFHKKIEDVVTETLEEFGHLYASQLVDITHVKNGPWDKVYNGIGAGQIIPEDLIYSDVLR